jgi:hypothetical protein
VENNVDWLDGTIMTYACHGNAPAYCTEGTSFVFIGDEGYYLSADGALMPIRKGQAPPDLKYFKTAK